MHNHVLCLKYTCFITRDRNVQKGRAIKQNCEIRDRASLEVPMSNYRI